LTSESACSWRKGQAVPVADAPGVPGNMTLAPLPLRSLELNAPENIRQFTRQNWLSDRVFRTYDDFLALCCVARNNLIDRPWITMSIGSCPGPLRGPQ
jgi:hypothetical protein